MGTVVEWKEGRSPGEADDVLVPLIKSVGRASGELTTECASLTSGGRDARSHHSLVFESASF